jgi:hypothetical protein
MRLVGFTVVTVFGVARDPDFLGELPLAWGIRLLLFLGTFLVMFE